VRGFPASRLTAGGYSFADSSAHMNLSA